MEGKNALKLFILLVLLLVCCGCCLSTLGFVSLRGSNYRTIDPRWDLKPITINYNNNYI